MGIIWPTKASRWDSSILYELQFFSFPSKSLLMFWEKQRVADQLLEFLYSHEKDPKVFLAPGFIFSQICRLWPFRKQTSEWNIFLCLCLSHSLFSTFKLIKKNKSLQENVLRNTSCKEGHVEIGIKITEKHFLW